MDVPSLTRALEAEGVAQDRRVRRGPRAATDAGPGGRAGVEVLGRDRLPEVQERLRERRRASPSSSTTSAARRRRVGCASGACSTSHPGASSSTRRCARAAATAAAKSNCLSVLPVDDRVRREAPIHDPSCNRDYTCLEGDCPSFVTVTPGAAEAPASEPGAAGRTAPGRRRAGAARGRPSRRPPCRPSTRQYGIYFTGIGGTGRGHRQPDHRARRPRRPAWSSAGMDQTGLSQKAGAVVSHLHLARDRERRGLGRRRRRRRRPVPVGRHPAGRGRSAPRQGATRAGPSPSWTRPSRPRRRCSRPIRAAPDLGALEQAITERVGSRPRRLRRLEADRRGLLRATTCWPTSSSLGAAFQLGGLPFSAEPSTRGHRRIRASGARDNWEAFEWGRWAVHDPDAVARRARGGRARRGDARRRACSTRAPTRSRRARRARGAPPAPTANWRRLLERRTAQVIDYQDVALAETFLDLVGVAAASRRRRPRLGS